MDKVNKEYEDWVYKCLDCKHSYKKQNDDDVLYCRKRNGKCEFSPRIIKNMKEGKITTTLSDYQNREKDSEELFKKEYKCIWKKYGD